ncbi:putative TfdA family oxidoreductase [Phycomyces blakesleeanus]|uniref:TauD/TfdA-like domain-containing protein n=1 Tax=Phycomyces blakesleeanus (strain ATCC 8743b / DSM 1359 / FGSC 10004 / NBRC 33097 / NRRL 1555) TaxID=763407 RepID=A0A167KI08_PHYB8|nr:hypothetical protein PHYBLDRAFT_23973 [Phycomyces blakesleeanus NRRL 1555(-)]OAD68149.1 hypothetical protein PHYBLDRAFT_23973 [Phycomyces blakesleeanus NRRL 1555(-)]|eukprot:XP_018286189.1 hypothetical protein PHYBLDRAFT_23973 [Phycomyces blakesleeanus NRRL 1555(-)]
MPTVQLKNNSQPDITYLPNYKKWKARTAHRLEKEILPTDLPAKFPKRLYGPKVWTGSDYEGKEGQWIYTMSKDELQEIHIAILAFEKTKRPLFDINQDTFPLCFLGPTIKKLIHEDVVDGRGFLILRGLDPEKYTRHQQIIAYAGISSYVGRRGLQGAHVLYHIKDMAPERGIDTILAPSYTNDHQVYHTDAGDIISLFAIGVAELGGKSKIASSWTVYNKLASTRPDLIHTLSEPWTFQSLSDINEHMCYKRPLLYYEDNHLIIQYARRKFTGFGCKPRSESIPPITEAQAEALDALHYISEKNHLDIEFKKGDIQYISNLSIFHAREGFIDSTVNRRHLLRLWLHPENPWKLPEQLQPLWNAIFNHNHKETFPPEPVIRW